MSPVWQPPAASAGGSVATDTIWDTKGDLAAATGADAAVKVAAGANGLVLMADSAQSAGVAWTPGMPDESYTEITSNVTISATTEAGATTCITAPAFTPNGTDAYWLEFYAARFDIAAVAGATVIFLVFDNGSVLSQIAQGSNPVAVSAIFPLGTMKRKLVPTNASHTYSIRAYRTGGNGLLAAGVGSGASTFMPAFLRIYRAT